MFYNTCAVLLSIFLATFCSYQLHIKYNSSLFSFFVETKSHITETFNLRPVVPRRANVTTPAKITSIQSCRHEPIVIVNWENPKPVEMSLAHFKKSINMHPKATRLLGLTSARIEPRFRAFITKQDTCFTLQSVFILIEPEPQKVWLKEDQSPCLYNETLTHENLHVQINKDFFRESESALNQHLQREIVRRLNVSRLVNQNSHLAQQYFYRTYSILN
jgi:hypothetical protein